MKQNTNSKVPIVDYLSTSSAQATVPKNAHYISIIVEREIRSYVVFNREKDSQHAATQKLS